MRGLEWASGKNPLSFTGAVFVISAQAVDLLQENSCTYGVSVSELTIYSYVGGNPILYTDPLGLDWFRDPRSTEDYVVGRRGTIVPPGGFISRFIELCVPAGQTAGKIHDPLVDQKISEGEPDWLANVPSMPGAYADAFRQETTNSLQKLDSHIRNLYRR